MKNFMNTALACVVMFVLGVFSEKEFGVLALAKATATSCCSKGCCCSDKLVPVPFENKNAKCTCGPNCVNGVCCVSCSTGVKCVCVNCECCSACNGHKL